MYIHFELLVKNRIWAVSNEKKRAATNIHTMHDAVLYHACMHMPIAHNMCVCVFVLEWRLKIFAAEEPINIGYMRLYVLN